MSRPCGGSDEVPVNVGLINRDSNVLPPCRRDFRAAGGIGGAPVTFDDSGSGQQLSSVTDRRDRFRIVGELPDQIQNIFIQTQVFGGSTTGNYEARIVARLDFSESRIQCEIVARLFTVCLIPFEIMDRRTNLISRFFAWTDGVDLIADKRQRLEWHHDFVVFDEVSCKEQ